MIYIAICPYCRQTVSFLNNEETKVCKCGEVITNTKHVEERPILKKRKTNNK